MIKQTTILLFVTMLLTGCIERGHILKPTIDHITPTTLTQEVKKQTSGSTTKIIKKNKATIQKEVVKSELPKKDFSIKSNKRTSALKIVMNPKTEEVETGFLSSISDETKNNISGFFVMLIGIIILL